MKQALKLAGVMAVAMFAVAAGPLRPYGLRVVDAVTGRGIPLVELRTVSNIRLYTDSAGYAALDDPAWFDHKVYFFVSSPGYEFLPVDGFGNRGVSLLISPGGKGTVRIIRRNIAERLYRVTGEGIYRDSILLGNPAPIEHPLLNAQVTGQDSVQAAVYHGVIHWFWGDTMRQSYPLGQFSTAGAVSDLPDHGGLAPAEGIDLRYFVDEEGPFSRPMAPPSGAELHWVDGLIVVKDDHGNDRLIATLTRLKDLTHPLGRELIVYDDKLDRFETLVKLDLKSPHLCGHPFHHTSGGLDYIYFGDAVPVHRVRTDWASIIDPHTCETNSGGVWRKSTGNDPPPSILHDAETGRDVEVHAGSVCWNEYRHKWVMIFVQRGGKSSFLGEVWYAEADAPEGPWREARQILTHDRYSFYNPTQHPFFDEQGGRVIYFEGTYSTTFSREGDATPRYNYNQIMYRLDLADPRLHAKP